MLPLIRIIFLSLISVLLAPIELRAQTDAIDAVNTFDAIEQLEADSQDIDAAVESQEEGGMSAESSSAEPFDPAYDGAEIIDLSGLDLEDQNSNWQQIANPRALNMTDSINIEQIMDPRADYRYSAFGKKDPFSPPSSDLLDQLRSDLIKEGPIAGEEIPIVSPLQAHSIDNLVVTGVWIRKKDQKARAVVVTPKGEAIVIKKGDPISAGKVLDIQRDYVLTRQYNIRSDGAREYSDLKLTVRSKEKKNNGFIRLLPGKKPQFLKVAGERNNIVQNIDVLGDEEAKNQLNEKVNNEDPNLEPVNNVIEKVNDIEQPAQDDLGLEVKN